LADEDPTLARWFREESLDGQVLRTPDGTEYGFISDEFGLEIPEEERSYIRFQYMLGAAIRVTESLRKEAKDG
jgi:hypothetical protein